MSEGREVVTDESNQFTAPQSIRSPNTGTHAMSIVYTSTTGSGSALNVVSENRELSALQVSGSEDSKGSIKVSHVNKSTSGAGDAGAAALSIDLQAGAEGATASQGIFLTSTTENGAEESVNTGPYLTVHRSGKKAGWAKHLFRILFNGVFEFADQEVEPAAPEVGKTLLYFKEGKLFVRKNGEAAKEVTIP